MQNPHAKTLSASDVFKSHAWKAAQFRQSVIRNGGKIPGKVASRIRGASVQHGNSGWPMEAMKREGYVRIAR